MNLSFKKEISFARKWLTFIAIIITCVYKPSIKDILNNDLNSKIPRRREPVGSHVKLELQQKANCTTDWLRA